MAQSLRAGSPGTVRRHAGRHRKARRRVQSYGWLGAGAVTLGIGAALAAGAVPAYADTGASSSEGHPSTSTTTRPDRVAKSTSGIRATASVGRSSHPSAAAASGTGHATAAASPHRAGTASPAGTPTTRPVVDVSGPTATDTPTTAAIANVTAPADPVTTALAEIASARAALNTTWSNGNVVAGAVSIVPQVLLSEAAWSLTTWQTSIAGAQASVKSTVGKPLVHQVANLALFGKGNASK